MTENKNLEEQIADDLSAVLKEAKAMGCKEVACFRHIPLQNVEIKINALYEVQKYRAIGTIDEFKALKEKSVPKKPLDGGEVLEKICPTCGSFISKMNNPCYCPCGQKLDWRE